MRKATTPTHTYTLPFSISTATDYSITYRQDGTQILKKSKSDSGVTESGTKILITLTQAETKLFTADKAAEIQGKFLIDGEVIASDIVRVPVKIIFDTTIMGA